MRPIKLTLQAFGPFKEKIVIPFENLGSGNIYLISGVTGSGKTTIFDAICYALFNSSSGSIRGNSSLKSHFASDETESFVEFDFMFNGEKYSILRHPSYERKKTRGEGFIIEQSKAQITLPNGKIIEKTKEVDEYIQNLLGLDVVQFSQIALLAQGEFLKLLNADTQTRAEVFRNIFKTWDYANFQNNLKDKMLELKNEYCAIENSILQHISAVLCVDEELNNISQKYTQNSCFDNLDDYILLLTSQNKKDIDSLELVKKETETIEKNISNLQNEFQKIQNKIQIQKQIYDFLSEKSVLDNEFKIIENDFKTIPELKNKLNCLLLEIKKIQDDYEKISEITKLKDEKSEVQTKNDEIEKEILATKEKDKTIKNNYLQFVHSQKLQLANDLANMQQEFLNFQNEVNQKSTKYDFEYNEYLKMQAGIIAQSLKNNQPCPVCGSLVHPAPAKIENKNLTKEYIDESKNELDELNKILFEKSNNCSLLAEKIKSKEDLFELLVKKYNLQKDNITNTQIDEIDFENEILVNEKELEALNSEAINISQTLSSIDSKIDLLLKNIKDIDIELILKNHETLEKEYETLKNKISTIEEKYNIKNVETNNLNSKIKLLEEQMKTFQDIDINRINEIQLKIEKDKEQILNLDKNIEEIISRKSINEKMLAEIVLKSEQFEKASKEYRNYKILSDCANGTLKGKVRMPFEQYIQGYYLDLVLYEANKRLKIMTQNQFQLFRKNDSFALNQKAGLDLEVMDFHTFKKRSTKTLSGGESFKAALALALGLSDCVSNFSGAINIDAMFIDEGFGSLDSESLELALDVVFSLSDNKRLIGLISHIEDLKSKIQNQIIVNKSQEGSSVEINF
ncbi:SMC family ATPase [bacterium]|nr:SMC family ATPase [bacterium]